MGCCGLCPDKKEKGEAQEAQGHQPTDGRPALTSIQSSASVYYDAPEDLEGLFTEAPHAAKPPVRAVHSSFASSDNESNSPDAHGRDDRQEESKGPLSAIVDVFTRRASIKGQPPLDRRASENGSPTEADRRGSQTGLGSASRDVGSPRPGPFSRPFAGASFKRGEQVGSTDGVECWQVADATSFKVRGRDYMSSRQKVNSRGAIYRLVGVDAYSFEQKIYHVAQHIQLPEAPQLGENFAKLPREKQLPPLLVLNIQLPLYKPGLLSRTADGRGVSLVYYFALPEGFELEHVENEAAVALMQRFVHDGKEHNGEKTRDRLKLIARVVNVEQWAKAGPLSGYEHGLLTKYNDKPILTRPQQAFFHGQNYMEIDLDIHSYAWVARQAFERFIPRLGPVVFENAFVVQGNRPEELPEVIMACARVSRIDLYKVQPFPASLRKTKSHRTTVEMHPDTPPLVCTTFPDDNLSRADPDEGERISEGGEEEAIKAQASPTASP